MGTLAHMEDFWNEFKTVKVRRSELRGSNSEEDSRSHEDDIDFDDSFLETILSDGVKEDREINETELANSKVYNTLTARQKAQVIRRTQERNFTLRQKRLKARHGQKPDLWTVFSATDNSSTGTRSRSATPDSLDSISPPRTPPDPSPKNWVEPHLSRSRASLDSGHHSLITSPCSSFPPSNSPNQHSETSRDDHHHPTKHYHHSDTSRDDHHHPTKHYHKKEVTRRCSPPEISQNNKYFYPSENGHRDRQLIYRAPSLDHIKHQSNYLRPNPKEVSVRRQRSYAKDINRDIKNYYGSSKGLYEFNPRLYYEPEGVDVQGIRYKPIGSIHIKTSRSLDKSTNIEDKFNPKETLSSSPKAVKRTQSIKHQPRDPFDPLFDNEYHLSHQNELLKLEDPHQEHLDNRTLSSSSTDFGFKILRGDEKENFPELLLEIGRSGQTKVDWLDSSDVLQLSSLALLELDIIFSEHNIAHSWRKRNKKRKGKESEKGVFGVSLESLNEKDKLCTVDPFLESNVPQILHKLIKHLELRGMKEEGILRIPGHRAKTEDLKKTLDILFYKNPDEVDSALRNASPNELAALVKLFLRELPHPLLTSTFAPAFYKTHIIDNIGEQVWALTMLVLLLPPSYRDTLKEILDLCAKVIAHENENKMGLYNVAMIIAPNIFLPNLVPKSKLPNIRGEDKEQQLNNEMEYARVTTLLCQAMIKYREILWTVPNRLVSQIRRQYEASLKPSSSKPIHRLLSKRNKDLIQRPIANEVEYQNGVLRISAPQFNKISHPVKLDWKMTAKDIVTKFIEDQTQSLENPHRVVGRREQQQSQSKRATPPTSSSVVMTTCLLRGSLKHALENHALHERGGNLVERRIDHRAHLIATYQDNPNGDFFIKCHHPGGHE